MPIVPICRHPFPSQAQSALEVYRGEYMQRRRSLGESTAWSARLWQNIKEEFHALPPEERARLQEQSEYTVAIARANRLRKKQAVQQEQQGNLPGPEALAQPAQQLAAMPHSIGGQRHILPVASACDWLGAADSLDSPVLGSASGQIADSLAAASSRSSEACSNDLPLSANMFCKLCEGLPRGARGSAGGVGGACKEFAKMLATPGKVTAARFPDRVRYETECGAWCRTATPKPTLDFHEHLLSRLSALTKDVCAKESVACRQSAIFLFEVTMEYAEDEDATRNFFVHLSSAMGHFGRHRPQQNFVLCDVLQDAEDGFVQGMELILGRDPFVPHHTGLCHPLRDQAYGALAYLTEDELAKKLICALRRPFQEDLLPSVITAQRLRYERMSADEFRILGLDDTHGPMFIVSDKAARRDGAIHLPPAPLSVLEDGEAESDGDSVPDMMDIFDQDHDDAQVEHPAPDPEALAEVSDEMARALGMDLEFADDAEILHILDLIRAGREVGDPGDPPAAHDAEGIGSAPHEEEAEAGGFGEQDQEQDEEEPFVVYEAPDVFAARMGLQPAPGWSYKDHAGDNVGYLRALPTGRSIKATCRRPGHVNCSLFLNVAHSYGHTCAELIAWLATGSGHGSAQSHSSAKPDLRAMCGE
jgi:hypothetical protein